MDSPDGHLWLDGTAVQCQVVDTSDFRPQRSCLMPNIAAVLKEEISRLAKKEVKDFPNAKPRR